MRVSLSQIAERLQRYSKWSNPQTRYDTITGKSQLPFAAQLQRKSGFSLTKRPKFPPSIPKNILEFIQQSLMVRKICQSKSEGTAAVELAVCLPIFVLLVVATLDICGMFFVQQSLKISAYEGARIGIVPNATTENIAFQIEMLLDDQGIEGYSINLDPADPETLSVGDYFTVTVSADFDQNAVIGGVYGGKTLSKSVTLQVE